MYEEAAGNITGAIKTISKSILPGRLDKAIDYFNLWLAKEKQDASTREKLKQEIINHTVREYLNGDKSAAIKSSAAAYLTALKFNLTSAEKYAKEAIGGINVKTSIEDVVLFNQNLAAVDIASGKYEKGLSELTSVENLAVSWQTDYWYLFGSTYEKIGNVDKTIDSYLAGSIFPEGNNIAAALQKLTNEKGITKDATDKRPEELKEGMKEFDTVKFKKTSQTNKVIVAELFTGAEYSPCVAAYEAFYKLLEYYPKNDVVILEYHVHIPGSDSMTNPDSFSKYRCYDGNFGTPTVFFDGTEEMTGGGTVYITKNRYTVYKYSLDRQLKEKPRAKITGSAEIKKDRVNVEVNIAPASKGNLDGCQIQVALVEKSIKYTGRNDIDKHIYVVRNLVNGTDGLKVNLTNGKRNIKETIDIARLNTGSKHIWMIQRRIFHGKVIYDLTVGKKEPIKLTAITLL